MGSREAVRRAGAGPLPDRLAVVVPLAVLAAAAPAALPALASLAGGCHGPPVIRRRVYSSTASMILVAWARVLAAATSRAPSPVSEVRIVAYSRFSEVS